MKTQILIRVMTLVVLGVIIGIAATSAAAAPTINVTINNRALDIASADAIAKELLTNKSYICLKKIIYKESRGNNFAKNTDSSARGIGQLLESTYRNLGMKHTNNEAAQLVAMLGYIGRKYGSGGPCAALKFHSRHNFY